MKTVNEATEVEGVITPKHEVIQTCKACGYDLDEAELAAATCSDCGASLEIKQDTSIFITTIPSAEGTTLI
jgi:methionyl-tRNA synthetase